jgi:hypothetical protein
MPNIRALAFAMVIATIGCAHTQTTRNVPGEAETVISNQVTAYNHRDIDAFVGFYRDDIITYEFPDKQRLSGIAEFRERYAKLFQSVSSLRASVDASIVQGHYVITRETVDIERAGQKSALHSTVIYLVEAGKIAKVWFMR